MRDKFRITLASIPKSKSGDSASVFTTQYKGQWKYFESLLFLKDQFTPRSHGGNFNISEDESNTRFSERISDDEDISTREKNSIQEPVEEDVILAEEQIEVLTPRSTPSTSRPTSASQNRDNSIKKKRSSNDNIGLALLDIEKRKIQYLEEKKSKSAELVKDEDLAFFKSLLPHVRKISAMEKLSYRMKILEITKTFVNPAVSIGSKDNNTYKSTVVNNSAARNMNETSSTSCYNTTDTNFDSNTGNNSIVLRHSVGIEETSARHYYNSFNTSFEESDKVPTFKSYHNLK